MLTRLASRSFVTTGLKVLNDVAKQQFVVTMNGHDAYISYAKKGNQILYDTTQVPEIFKGKGVGKLLAKHAFDYAKENKLDVTIGCSFLEAYYEKNKQDYKSLKVTIDLHDEEENEPRK